MGSIPAGSRIIYYFSSVESTYVTLVDCSPEIKKRETMPERDDDGSWGHGINGFRERQEKEKRVYLHCPLLDRECKGRLCGVWSTFMNRCGLIARNP